jgi:hypothetical protein
VQALLAQESVGSRMDFDTEIVVRLHWRGVRVINLPTPVRYPMPTACRTSSCGWTTR